MAPPHRGRPGCRWGLATGAAGPGSSVSRTVLPELTSASRSPSERGSMRSDQHRSSCGRTLTSVSADFGTVARISTVSVLGSKRDSSETRVHPISGVRAAHASAQWASRGCVGKAWSLAGPRRALVDPPTNALLSSEREIRQECSAFRTRPGSLLGPTDPNPHREETRRV